MLNPIANQVNSSNPTTDNADRSVSVMVVNSGTTRVQQLLRVVEETCPINVRFKEKFPNYDWDGTRKSWEVFFQRKEVQSGLGFVDGKPKNNSVSLIGKVELLTQACELTALGIPVMATTEMKRVFKEPRGFRKKLYDAPLSVGDLLESYKSTSQNVVGLAVLTGPISPKHDFVAFDFERPELKDKFIETVQSKLPNLSDAIKETYWETTAGGGHHFFAWVPSGEGRDTDLAKKKTGELDEKGNEKFDLLIEIKGSENSYIIIAPSKAESDKTGVKAIGQYKSTNGPLINNDGLRAVTLDLEDFESLKAICKSFDVSPIKVEAKPKQAASTPKPKPIQIKTENQKEGKLQRAERYLKETYGWTGLAEEFGYEIVGGGEGRLLGLHPGSTKKDHNCVFGPQELGNPDTFRCFGNWHIKGPINYAQFYADNNGGGKEAWAKLFKEVDDAWGELPDDSEIVDDTLLGDFNAGDKRQDNIEDESYELMNPASKDITAYEIQEANKAEEILRSPVKDSLINVFGDTYKNTAKSKHAQTVIGYAAGISHLGHYSADLIWFNDTVPVNHTLIMAKTCSGKDHPRDMFGKININLVEIQRERFKANQKKEKDQELPKVKPLEAEENEALLYDEAELHFRSDEEEDDIKNGEKVTKKTHGKDWVAAVINPKGSFQGLEDQLCRHPHCMIEINEIGDFENQASKKNSTGERYKETTASFKPLHDCPAPYVSRAISAKKPIHIRGGVLPSILGYSTPEGMLGAFDQARIEGGGLNRWLFLIAGPRWVRDANGNRIKPTDRHGGKKAARKLAKLVDEHREFFKTELRKNRKKITASDEFKKVFDKYLLLTEELEEIAQNNREDEEGITGREELLIIRLCLTSLFSRKSLVLEPVDFDWAYGVVKLSQKNQQIVAFKCGESSSETTSGKLNNKIRGVIKKLYDEGKPLTPSAIGNKLYTNKHKRTKSYFIVNHEPTLIQFKWIKVLNDGSYELTPNFWKVGKK